MELENYYPELKGIDVLDISTKIPLHMLNQDDQLKLGKALAEHTIDNMETSHSVQSVNYIYQYYFNMASLPNSVIVEALLAIKKED